MQNSKEESQYKNVQDLSGRTNSAARTRKQELNTTSQSMVSSKNEVTIGNECYKETKWFFEQYGQKKPDWLRKKFLINQYRRKCLNSNFREAQLDKAFCGKCTDKNDWSGLLHMLWHEINQEPICK